MKFGQLIAYNICQGRQLPKHIENKALATCFFLIFSIFENKKRSGASLLDHSMHEFSRKIFFTLYSVN